MGSTQTRSALIRRRAIARRQAYCQTMVQGTAISTVLRSMPHSRDRETQVSSAAHYPAPPRLRSSDHCRGQRTRPTISASAPAEPDRKSTRLNSSHGYISYAVFCLKKKKHKLIKHPLKKKKKHTQQRQ